MPKNLKGTPMALLSFDQLPDSAFVRITVLIALLTCSRTTIWRWVRDGRLPQPLHLGSNISVWSVGEIRRTLKKLAERNSL